MPVAGGGPESGGCFSYLQSCGSHFLLNSPSSHSQTILLISAKPTPFIDKHDRASSAASGKADLPNKHARGPRKAVPLSFS